MSVWIVVASLAHLGSLCLVDAVYFKPELTRATGWAEHCATQHFQPQCQPGEVIVMTKAFYGMEKLGDCITTDFGFVGCGVDVLKHMDGQCSAQTSCDVQIPNEDLENISLRSSLVECPKEFKSYLNASYNCVQVRTAECRDCLRSRGNARVTSPYGYIGSVTSTQSGANCGMRECPWLIEGKPGQVIKLTLFDFHAYDEEKYQYTYPEFCIRLGSIRDRSSPKDFDICGGRGRHQKPYTSVSNSVEISFTNSQGNKGQVLIYFEITGCPDLDTKDADNIEKIREKDTLRVRCRANGVEYVLKCVGEEWKGELGSCPAVLPSSRPQLQGIVTLHKGVLAAIVIGIAIIVGVLILTIGVVCLKRQQPHHGYYYPGSRHDYEYAMDAGSQLYMAPKNCPQPAEPSKYQPVLPQHRQHHDRHWHQRKMDLQARPLPSLPNITEASATTSGSSKSEDDLPQQSVVEVHAVPDTDRRYLTNPRPAANRRHSANSSGANSANNSRGSSKTDPQYFILEGDNPHSSHGLAAAQARHAARAAGVMAPAPAPPTSAATASAAAAITPTMGSDSGSSDKDYEDENKQNSDKELSRNNSCHEIPLRPTRELPNVNNVRTENTTGKTSWP